MPPSADPWAEWDNAREAGELPTEMARGLSDEDVARLISEAGSGRDDERKLLAAEALRRTTDLEQARNRASLPEDPQAEAHRTTVNRAAERIHAAERRLERASASQKLAPDLQIAHETSLRAEEHRGHVETGIVQRAKHREAIEKLRERLEKVPRDERE